MNDATRAGFRIKAFMRDLGDYHEKSYYGLNPRPRSVKIGRTTLIIESAKEYVERVAAMTAEQTAAALKAEHDAKKVRARRAEKQRLKRVRESAAV
jgi:hypothetical protein